ncbi:MAG: hypothetical protein DME75_05100 [Verrucomicrobia bacterium]|nr:MAG: hypothetical protein DME75_05100 [Verrucomicrobiota bacterium]
MLFPLRNTRFVPCLEQHLRLFEPGGPQRENACGLFIPRIVRAACKMKRARPASRPGFCVRIFFADAKSHPRRLGAVFP